MRNRDGLVWACSVWLLMLPAHRVFSTGFYIPQQSVAVFGRASAGAAALPSDASTVFYNPAGLIEPRGRGEPGKPVPRGSVTLRMSLLAPRVELANEGSTIATPGTGGAPVAMGGSDGGNPAQPELVPGFNVAVPLDDGRAALGAGFSAPFGLSSRFKRDWFGRYDAIESNLTTKDLALVGAVRVADWLSLGGGINIQHADAKLTRALPNTALPGGPTLATDGLSILDGDSTSVGFTAGALARLGQLSIGAHYRSPIRHRLEGTATVAGLGGPLAALNGTLPATVDLELPRIISLGAAYRLPSTFRPGDELILLGSVAWFGWSSFDEIRVRLPAPIPDEVVPQNYRNVWNFSVGAEYRYSSRWTVRTGFEFSQTPTVDGLRSPNLPTGNSYLFAAGASYSLGPVAGLDDVTLDTALGYAIYDSAPVTLTRTVVPLGLPGSLDLRAKADNSVFTAALAVRMRF